MLAGLSYPFWFVVVPFVMFSARREEPFVQFHARQSLWLGLGSLLTTVVGAFLCWAFMAVMPSGSVSGLLGVGAFVGLWLVFLFLFFLFFFLGYRASAGEFYRLPVVGEKALVRTLDDLGLTTADLEATAPPSRAAAPPPPVAPVREVAASPPPALSELRPPSSVRTGPPLRPLPTTPRVAETRKTWEPSAVKADPTNVLKRWLTDEEAQG
jgi:uncharacterized membrane protein